MSGESIDNDLSASAAGLAQLQGAETALQNAVSSGQFGIEPAVANQAATYCDDLASQLSGSLKPQASALGANLNLGACWIGDDLATKFERKADGSSDSVTSILAGAVTLLRSMADLYRGAGANYIHTDETNTQALRGTSPGN